MYVLTSGGTFHRYPALEQCNLDDADIVETYEHIPVSRGNQPIPPGKPCEHCRPLDRDFRPTPPGRR